jgi:Zn-dependent protease with chaperone function
MDFDYQEDYERTQEQYRRSLEGLLSSEYIDSPITVRLLDEVWERIPEDDREILFRAIDQVSDQFGIAGSALEYVLGAVDDIIGTALVDGVDCILPWQNTVSLNAALLAECNEAAAKAVIAHELAHVVLRHLSVTYSYCMLHTLSGEDGILAQVSDVHEWDADLQAWMWGFSDELRQLWEHLERDPPPWYHQISLEPPD